MRRRQATADLLEVYYSSVIEVSASTDQQLSILSHAKTTQNTIFLWQYTVEMKSKSSAHEKYCGQDV